MLEKIKNVKFSKLMLVMAVIGLFGSLITDDDLLRITGDIWLVGALVYGKLEDLIELQK